MRGAITAFSAILLFSLYAVFGKLLLQEVNPVVILVVNQLLAYSILYSVLKLVRNLRKIKKTSKKDFKLIYLLSIFSAVGGPLLFLMGLKITSATNTILIQKTEAIFTTLLAIIILKDKITKHQIAGALTMFFGVFLIATNSFRNGLSFNLGDIIILLSSLSFAIGTVLFKRYIDHVPPEIIVTLRNLCGATLLFVVSLYFVDYSQLYYAIGIKFIIILLGLVALTTILGQYLWYKALELSSAATVSLVGLSSPLISIFYVMIFLKETISFSQLLGGSFILLGLIFLEFHFKIWPTKRHTSYLKLKHWPH